MLARVWRGRVGLAWAFWLVGLVGGTVAILPLAVVLRLNAAWWALIFFTAWAAYTVWAQVGVWRSARSHSGWAQAARLLVLLHFLNIPATAWEVLGHLS
jgi:hypothetical protein